MYELNINRLEELRELIIHEVLNMHEVLEALNNRIHTICMSHMKHSLFMKS